MLVTWFLRATTALAVAFCCVGVTAAQDYPNKPIRIIVPWPSGTSPDLISRTVGQDMSKRLGQPVVL